VQRTGASVSTQLQGNEQETAENWGFSQYSNAGEGTRNCRKLESAYEVRLQGNEQETTGSW